MRTLRETRWVRVYETTDGEYIDSKYRTYECDADAQAFVAAWRSADVAERRDLIAAFRWFPRPGVGAVVAMIAATAPAAASALERAASDKGLGEHREFLAQHYSETGKIAAAPVGENPWFRATFDGVGFSFEDNPKAPPATYAEYCRLFDHASTRIYRDAINLYFGVEPGVRADERRFQTLDSARRRAE